MEGLGGLEDLHCEGGSVESFILQFEEHISRCIGILQFRVLGLMVRV